MYSVQYFSYASVHAHVCEDEWAKYMSMQCDACAHMYTHVQCMCADTGEESTALVFNVDPFFI